MNESLTMKTVGFYYVGFRQECYFFEVLYMLRGVFFQCILGGPMMVTPEVPVGEHQKYSGAAITMGLLTIIFIFIHYLMVPYDNRAHNALNRMEASMLWALLTTSLGQALIQTLDTTEAFANSEGARYARNTIVCIVVIEMHLKFIYEIVRSLYFSFTNHDEHEAPLVIRAEGVETRKLSPGSKRLFARIITDVAKLQLRLGEAINF